MHMTPYLSRSTTAARYGIDISKVAPLPATPYLEAQLGRFRSQKSALRLVPKDFQASGLQDHYVRSCVAGSAAEFLLYPGAELHCHRGAAGEIIDIAPLAWDLSAKTDGRLQAKYRSLDSMVEAYSNVQDGSLDAYLARYNELPHYVNKDLDAIYNHVYTAARRNFDLGIRIYESRTSIKSGRFGDPRYRQQMTEVKFTPEEELDTIAQALLDVKRDVGGNFFPSIGIFLRRNGALNELMSYAAGICDLAEDVADRVGYDIVSHFDGGGAESSRDPEGRINSKAKRLDRIAKYIISRGKKLTMHAGEAAGEGSILQGIEIGASRIGHGTVSFRPHALLPGELQWMNRHGLIRNAMSAALVQDVSFEACVSSNLACQPGVNRGIIQDADGQLTFDIQNFEAISDYPALRMIAFGSLPYLNPGTAAPHICTDGLHLLNTNQTRERALFAEAFEIGPQVMLALSLFAIDRSFSTDEAKATVREELFAFSEPYFDDSESETIEEQMVAAYQEYGAQLRENMGLPDHLWEALEEELNQPSRLVSDEARRRRDFRQAHG